MKIGRFTLLIIPAVIFWVVSMRFFIMGMTIDDTTGQMMAIAIGLTIANTIIQVVGNGFSKDELGPILYYGWLMSYVLGVSSNFYALTLILNIPIPYVEYAIAGSLGSMIEFMPEKMFVMFWNSTFPRGFTFNFLRRNKANKGYKGSQNQNYASQRPKGMSREEWQNQIRERYQAEQSRTREGYQSEQNRIREGYESEQREN